MKFNFETIKKILSECARDIAVSLVFLTRIPLRLPFDFQMERLKTAAGYFPLVGILTGLTGGLIYGAGYHLGFGPTLSALLAIAGQVLITGALHEDAIADVADGFGGGKDKEQKLAIMRDSRIGAYGVLALIIVVSLKIFAIARLEDPALVTYALVGAAAAGRAAMSGVMYILPPARDDGLGRDAGEPEVTSASLALLFGILICTLLFGTETGAFMLGLACIGAGILAWIAHRQIAGKTGDVLGAALQIAEIFCLLGLVASIY